MPSEVRVSFVILATLPRLVGRSLFFLGDSRIIFRLVYTRLGPFIRELDRQFSRARHNAEKNRLTVVAPLFSPSIDLVSNGVL